MSEQSSQSFAIRRWSLITYWIAMFAGTHWPELGEYGPLPFFWLPWFDQVVHGMMYAGWAAIWWWMLSAGGRRVSEAAGNWLILGGAAYAILDEGTQAIVARHPSVLDFAADVIGLLVAVSILNAWERRRWRV